MTRPSASATGPRSSATASAWSPTSARSTCRSCSRAATACGQRSTASRTSTPTTRELRWPAPGAHQAVVGAACERIRADLAGRGAVRSVVLAHAFVAGAEPSDSERSIMVGGVDRVAGTVFEGIDYAALGHLHGPQSPDSADGSVVRYSGSPLRYSFSEQDQVKAVLLVDLPANGPVEVTAIEIDQPRPMATLHGTLDHLLD